MPDGRRVNFGVRVSEATAALVDEVRGDVSRSAWAEAAIRDKLAEAGAVVTAGRRAAPVRQPAKAVRPPVASPKFRAPADESCDHRRRDLKNKSRCISCGAMGPS